MAGGGLKVWLWVGRGWVGAGVGVVWAWVCHGWVDGVWVGVGGCGCMWVRVGVGGVITVATSRFGRPPIPATGRCGADDECSSPTDARKSFVASECERAILASDRISR